MSSRRVRREEARAAREAAERAEAAKATRARRLRALGVVAAIAVALVIAGIVVSQSSEDPSTGPRDEATGLVGVAETRAQFDGLTQEGTTLGSPDAELVLTEFADLQCPFCARFATQQLPGIIDRYVRSGDVRLELRTRTFLGEDSVRAARAAQAAGTRDRMWQFVDLFYRNQGEENSGYATDDFLASVARGVGLPAELVVDGARSRALDAGIRRADREAQAAGLSATPAFLLGEEAGEGRAVEPDQVEAALAEAVGGT